MESSQLNIGKNKWDNEMKCELCIEGLKIIEHLFVRCPKMGKVLDNVAECIEKSLHCRIIISPKTIVIGSTSVWKYYGKYAKAM